MEEDWKPSLPYMLATVPHLLASCLSHWEGQVHGIKVLRLVCKETGRAAVAALSQCSIQLGENACLKPGQVVRLMRSAKLECLVVTITTSSGELACTTSILSDDAATSCN